MKIIIYNLFITFTICLLLYIFLYDIWNNVNEGFSVPIPKKVKEIYHPIRRQLRSGFKNAYNSATNKFTNVLRKTGLA